MIEENLQRPKRAIPVQVDPEQHFVVSGLSHITAKA
jgi:hypothetical protein